ncbi:hypothetical protein [Paraglaciecola sp. L3A3]|uniref:hypothetical protein n=1 Tax=Paraglaciecola sp. L3A3 TaxID=2686358 RepID=UPI00131B3842|nr:hypothetical protein [Paraglaciecola sp. L3A3]
MWQLLRWGAALLIALSPLYLVLYHALDELNSSPEIAPEAISLTLDDALVFWHKGKYKESLVILDHIDKSKPEVSFYRAYFERYLQHQVTPQLPSQTTFAENCSQKILFVTGDVYSLAQATVFMSRFANDERLATLPICIEPTIWFDPAKINCQQNQTEDGRLACDLPQLAKSLKAQNFTHLVVFADKGKANVHNGIMFLDRQDSYDVFVHELAHFAGFVDEYPLTGQLAAQICAGDDTPNLVFRKAGTQVIDTDYWQSIGLDSDLSLTKARTCDNHPNQAYKVEKKLTFMEYHDVAYIPEHYLAVWQKRLSTQTYSPSAHVNFAQFYEGKNNLRESQFWRTKYQGYLKN